MLTKVGSFQKTTSGAPASQAITGVGFQPKALILFLNGPTALNTFTDDHYWSMGLTSGASASYAIGGSSQHNVATANRSQRYAAKALTIVKYGEVLQAECDLTSFDSDGFTLNWTTNDANAYQIGYVAIGGSDITAQVIDWTGNVGNDTDRIVTGVGFRPDMIFTIVNGATSVPLTAAGAHLGFGVVDRGGGEPVACGYSALDGSGNQRSLLNSNSAITLPVENTGSWYVRALPKTWDSDGFTWHFDLGQSTWHFASLCIKGGVWQVGMVYKPTTGGPATQTIEHAKITQPKLLMMLGPQGGTVRHWDSSQSPAQLGFGVTDGTNAVGMAFRDNQPANTFVKSIFRTDKFFIKDNNDTPTQDAIADLPVLGGGRSTISWGTNDANDDLALVLVAGDQPNPPAVALAVADGLR